MGAGVVAIGEGGGAGGELGPGALSNGFAEFCEFLPRVNRPFWTISPALRRHPVDRLNLSAANPDLTHFTALTANKAKHSASPKAARDMSTAGLPMALRSNLACQRTVPAAAAAVRTEKSSPALENPSPNFLIANLARLNAVKNTRIATGVAIVQPRFIRIHQNVESGMVFRGPIM